MPPQSELPSEAIEKAFRKLARVKGVDFVHRSRALHRLLVDGVKVEYRDVSGAIRGAQARVLDYDDPSRNYWLAVKEFAVAKKKHVHWDDVVLLVNRLPRDGEGHKTATGGSA